MGFRTVRFDGIIVALGKFNPAIVTPEWLRRQELISDSDLEACMSKLQAMVQEGLMAFDCSWFSFRLVQNQFVLATVAGATPRIRDLAVGIFSVLPETPISAVGLNFASDIQFDSVDEYHKLGDVLAPKAVWKELFPDLGAGLVSLQIAVDKAGRGQATKNPTEEQVRFTIEPSNAVGPNAVHIAFNHHYPLTGEDGARSALKVMKERWQADLEEAERSCGALVARTQV